MSIKTPNELLDDILFKGILHELSRIERYRGIDEEIARNATALNRKGYGNLFWSIQELCNSEMTLALNKVFERVSKKHQLRSIPVALEVLQTQPETVVIMRKGFILEELAERGIGETHLASMSDSQITGEVYKYFANRLPSAETSDALSAALGVLKTSRDKIIAHHEIVERESLPRTTFGNIWKLIAYVREFLEVVGSGYTNIRYNSEENWFSVDTMQRTAIQLKHLLAEAGVTN